MDELCANLLVAGNLTDDVTTAMTSPVDDLQRRMRRFVDVADDDDVNRVSLLSLFLAVHNQSWLQPAATTAAMTSAEANVTNVTEIRPMGPASLVAERFGGTATFSLVAVVSVVGSIMNAVALGVIASDSGCPVHWRLLRLLGIVSDTFLLLLLLAIFDVTSVLLVTSFSVYNTLGAVVGWLQYVQPWTLYIVATYIHRLLLDERHKVPPQWRVGCPVVQLLVMVVVGAVYFTIYLPPVRVAIYKHVASHSALCTVPLFDQWQLTVGSTSSTDLLYYLCYDWLYTLAVYVAPIVPLFYRDRRLVDAIFRRQYRSLGGMTSRALGRCADVMSVTCGIHIVTHCLKATMLTMRLAEAVTTDKYMQAGRSAFRQLDSFGNLAVLVRPLIHLPVMIVYDRRVRVVVVRAAQAARDHIVATVARFRHVDDESEYWTDDSIELDSIQLEEDDDKYVVDHHLNADNVHAQKAVIIIGSDTEHFLLDG